MTIREYLRQLERRLPLIRRGRALAETEAHLRETATRYERSGMTRLDAEESATRDFGDVHVVARQFAAEIAVSETRIATALALVAVAVFVFPLYVVPENTLPPATWPEKPVEITVLQIAAVGLWLGAGALASASAVLAWTRWARSGARMLELVPVLLGATILVSGALVVRWLSIAADAVWWPLISGPLALTCFGACVMAAAWAHVRRSLLDS